MTDKIFMHVTEHEVRFVVANKQQGLLLAKAFETFGKFFHQENCFQVIDVDEKKDSDNRCLLERLVKDPEKLKVIDKALDKGVLRISGDGRLVRVKGSKTLLAYFIGRLFAYDEVYEEKYSKELCWKLCARFPDKLVEQLFVDGGLRSLRKNRRDMPLPKGHEMIDELFI